MRENGPLREPFDKDLNGVSGTMFFRVTNLKRNTRGPYEDAIEKEFA